MRLVSFNILHGQGASPGELAAACMSLSADILCLQEVDDGQPRSEGVDQAGLVAGAIGANHWRFAPAVAGEPGGEWRPATNGEEAGEGPRYGVALMSRRPVRHWEVWRFDAAPTRSPVYVPTARRFVLLHDEPRVAVVAHVETRCGTIVVAGTHLSFVPGWNAWQLRRITTRLGRLRLPAVLLGDLNLPGPLPRLVTGWRPLAAVKTFPAHNPSMQIDHALGRGALPPVIGADAPRLALSDHRALVVDLGE